MGLKPHTARWFELLTPRDALAPTVESLARSGHAQIEAESDAPAADEIGELAGRIERYEALARRYRPYFPEDGLRPSKSGVPARLLDDALTRLGEWAARADPLIRKLEFLERERRDLLLLKELVEAGGASLPDFGDLRRAGPSLSARIVVLAQAAPALALPSGILRHRIDAPGHTFLLLVGAGPDLDRAYQALAAFEPKQLELPPEAGIEPVQSRVDQELADQHQALQTLHQKYEIRRSLADIRRLRWFASQVPCFPHTENFSIVTGWADDWSGEVLQGALEREGISGILHFPPAPERLDPPIILVNPPWARPFERFAALLGTPSRYETDPSMVLAFVAPILFGYMFGDVGHGLVLALFGFLIRKRVPTLAMLVPAGLVGSLFGLVFGCVFTIEGPIRPLWVHPLEHPMAVLAGALGIGAGVLLLGVFLAALGTIWRGAFPSREIALILIYFGLAAAFVNPLLGLLVPGGFLLAAIGEAIEATTKKLRAALRGIGELFERSLQLFVNTLSFARVGAFALAHAGLATAVMTLFESAEHPVSRILLLIFGNLLILLLEGLVVSIQTARLVLFEFFARFLHAEGRVFRPLVPPSAARTA